MLERSAATPTSFRDSRRMRMPSSILSIFASPHMLMPKSPEPSRAAPKAVEFVANKSDAVSVADTDVCPTRPRCKRNFRVYPRVTPPVDMGGT